MSCERTYGSATDAIAAYRGQIERGTHFIEVNRMQLSLLRQLMRIYKDRSLNLLHGGPGFSGLAPAIVQYLCTGSLDKSKHLVTIEDLYDLELKEILEEQVSDSYCRHFRSFFLFC